MNAFADSTRSDLQLQRVLLAITQRECDAEGPDVQVIRRLGGGRDADVWLLQVNDRSNSTIKWVAKIFRDDGKNGEFMSAGSIQDEYECLSRFWDEVQKVSDPTIRCPRPYYMSGTDRFYIMDYIDGEAIFQAVQKGLAGDAQKIALRLSEALSVFYRANQREFADFSALNVIIDSRGAVCLLDPMIADPSYKEIKTRLGVSNAAADVGYWVFWHSMAALCNRSWWRKRPTEQWWRITRELIRSAAVAERLTCQVFKSTVRKVALAHWDRFVAENGSLPRRIGAQAGRLIVRAVTL